MNEEIKKLAKDAGFIFWEDESWGPGPDVIDWSCEYDDEFDKFIDLVQNHYQQKINTLQRELTIAKTQNSIYRSALNDKP